MKSKQAPRKSAIKTMRELMENPSVVGCIVSSLRSNALMEQQHRDNRKFDLFWREIVGGGWRCTAFLDSESELCLVQVELHPGSIRVEVFEPCNVTIEEEEGLLWITRYDPRQVS